MQRLSSNRGPRHRAQAEGPRKRRGRGDKGVALVEFAVLAPFLFLLIFAIIEFGWAFYQNVDVRHGSRETARLAAVNYRPAPADTGATQTTKIIAEGCARMDAPANTSIQLTLTNTNGNAATGDIGDTIRVRVEKPLDQLTGFLGPFLNNKILKSDVDIRVEQTASWTANGSPEFCP